MNSFVVAISITGGVILIVAILNWIAETIRENAVINDRLDRLQEEAELAREQAEAMQKEVSVEDVARDLDAGEF